MANTKKKQTAKSRNAIERGRRAYMAGRFKDAMDIWLPLAEADDGEAQSWVGSLYANGDGVEVDDAVAFKWYLRSAEGGNAPAQSNVGALYAMSKGVKQDFGASERWTRAAAEGGDANAQFNLAVFYTKGQGVPQDDKLAADWYRKASEGGHYPSQARLGHMYANGQGVAKDRVHAFLWLSLASQHGVGTALAALEGVVKQMSSDEKSEGSALVSQWRGKTAAVSERRRLDPIPS